jgi:hypothetical protein
MKKRGQFYILAATLIVLTIAGLAGISTYAIIKSKPKTINSLSADLKNEGPNIVDFGIYGNSNITALIENFTDKEFAGYFLGKTNRANIVFIYGNRTNLYAVEYNSTYTGGISSSIGGGFVEWKNVNTYIDRTSILVNPDDKQIDVEILNSHYKFNLTEGEMFYFVIVQEKDGERYVQRN